MAYRRRPPSCGLRPQRLSVYLFAIADASIGLLDERRHRYRSAVLRKRSSGPKTGSLTQRYGENPLTMRNCMSALCSEAVVWTESRSLTNNYGEKRAKSGRGDDIVSALS